MGKFVTILGQVSLKPEDVVEMYIEPSNGRYYFVIRLKDGGTYKMSNTEWDSAGAKRLLLLETTRLNDALEHT